MITKLIAVFVIVLVLFGAYGLFSYYKSVEDESRTRQAEAAAKEVKPEQLAGMPYGLQDSLRAAQQAGPKVFASWLANYGKYIQDPRLAWIELDYVVAVSRDDPAEARRIFTTVKDRTPSSSPVYPRIQELAKSYE